MGSTGAGCMTRHSARASDRVSAGDCQPARQVCVGIGDGGLGGRRKAGLAVTGLGPATAGRGGGGGRRAARAGSRAARATWRGRQTVKGVAPVTVDVVESCGGGERRIRVGSEQGRQQHCGKP